MALVDRATVLAFMGQDPSTAKATDIAIIDMLISSYTNMIKDYLGYEVEFDTYTEYYPEGGTPVDDDQLIYGWEVVGGKAVPMDYRTQKARGILQMRQLPVREIVSIHEAPGAWDSYPPTWLGGQQLVEGINFRVDYVSESMPGIDPLYPRISHTGHVLRRTGIWSPIARCVRVIYKAGYTASELNGRFSIFKLAALHAVVWGVKEAKFNAMKGGGTGILVAETIGTWSQTFAPPVQMASLGLQYALPPSVMRMLESKVGMSKYLAG